MMALVSLRALGDDESHHVANYMQDYGRNGGLVVYRDAFDKLVELGLAKRSGERGSFKWRISDAGREYLQEHPYQEDSS